MIPLTDQQKFEKMYQGRFENTVFVGSEAFERLSKGLIGHLVHMDFIQYGYVAFVLNKYLSPCQMVTMDPDLSEIIKRLKSEETKNI